MITISNSERDRAVRYLRILAGIYTAMQHSGDRSPRTEDSARLVMRLARSLQRKKPQPRHHSQTNINISINEQ